MHQRRASRAEALPGRTVKSVPSQLSDEQIRANRFELVSRLADDLAHEVKNPLNAIVINLEVLKVRISKGDTEAALARAGVIGEETRRLHQLVDRLLQLLRPNREEAASLALNQAFDELLPLIEARARLARNVLNADCAAAVYLPIQRDVFKFATLNLLTAIHDQLGEGGGSLDVQCTVEDGSVRIGIIATATPPGALRPASGAQLERASEIAASLLSPCGARIEPVAGGVAMLLPRGAPV